MKYDATIEFAQRMDLEDPIRSYRDRFHFPQFNGEDILYFGGNSLGLMPKTSKAAVNEELDVWEKLGVTGQHDRWEAYHEYLTDSTARLVGAKPNEVVVMNALTVNLHFLLISFYQPTNNCNKIVIEKGAFPSDQYAVESQIAFHGFDPKEALIELTPRDGEKCLRTEDILNTLRSHGESIATILIGGVNYYTGQAFDIETISKVGHEIGAMVGFDLAHAAGNLTLKLHDWNVDFAAWCSYKYLCAGPGSPGGVFIHDKHADWYGPRFAGWWGHNKKTRFKMKPNFKPIMGAEGWQVSNAPILSMACLRDAMDIYDEVGMSLLREKSEQLTEYLEFLLLKMPDKIEIITPEDPKQRGCQLSLVVKENGKEVFEKLSSSGVICDWREPDVIRVAPMPMYNSYKDIFQFYEILKTILD